MRPIVPYLEPPKIAVFGRDIHLFGTLVVLAVIVGVVVARRRVRSLGLDRTLADDAIVAALIPGFLLAHATDVLAYHPERLRENPLELLRFWGSASSYGGILGAILGMLVFVAARRPAVDRAERMRILDTIAYGFPFGWVFGRLGCTLALDHPGRITDFVLATSLESMDARLRLRSIYVHAGLGAELPGDAELALRGFHNLGFYELIYTVLVVVPVMLVTGRRERPPGFFLFAFFAVYAPMRFALDFLRVGDATYAGLTPAQYVSLVAMLAVTFVGLRGRFLSR